MLKAAASQRYKHDKALKHKPSNMKDWQHANQLKKLPDIISKRIANMELRRQFLEGQSIRNRANEKMRLQNNLLEHHRVPDLMAQRFRARVRELDENPANRAFIEQHRIMQPIIGRQPSYYFT